MFATRLFGASKSRSGRTRSGSRLRPKRNVLSARRMRVEPLEARRLLSVDSTWLFSLGGDFVSDTVLDVTLDANENIYAAGKFEGTVDFDPGPASETRSSVRGAGFVAKYAPDRTVEWVQHVVGVDNGSSQFHRVVVDSNANVYVSGHFYGTIQVGNDTLTGPTEVSIFAAKLNSSGQFQWSTAFALNGGWHSNLAVDEAGNPYVIAQIQNSTIVKLNTDDGSVLWTAAAGGDSYAIGMGIAVDANGVYATGCYGDGADFGDTVLSSTHSVRGAFVTELNPVDGTFVWAVGMDGVPDVPGNRTADGRDITIGGDGLLYLAGAFSGAMNFGSQQLTAAGITDAFFSKLDTSGNILQTWQVEGPGDNRGRVIDVDSEGNMYVGGVFSDTADFDPGPNVANLTSVGDHDGFLLKLNNQGSYVGAWRWGGPQWDYANGIDVDGNGNMYVAGSFERNADFPNGELTTPAGRDGFLMKYNPLIQATPITAMVTTEEGGTATFKVELQQAPAAGTTVTVNISSSDPSEGVVSPAGLTFSTNSSDADYWELPHTVTVTGVDDALKDSDVIYTVDLAPAVSDDPRYDGVDAASVSVINEDDETDLTTFTSSDVPKEINDMKGKTPGTTLSTLTVSQPGSIVDLDVRLTIFDVPADHLDVSLIAPDGTRVRLFDDVGGAGGQNFEDTILDDEASTDITAASAPFAGRFRPEEPLSAFDSPGSSTENLSGIWTLEIVDDTKFETGTLNSWSISVVYAPSVAQPGVTVSPTSGLVTGEDGTADTFTVVLDTQPTADVTVGISSDDPTEGTVDEPSLVFTPTNWDVPQTVTVTGVNDDETDGDAAYTIVTAQATGATEYEGINPADVAVTNQDDDGPTQPTVFYSMDTPLTIADAHPNKGSRTTTSELDVTTHDLIQSLSIEITLDGSSDVSDLGDMVLTSPMGTSVSTITPVFGTSTLDLAADFLDEDPYGIWTLAISDNVKGNSHTLTGWSLSINDPAQAAAAVDMALLEWIDLDSSDDEDTDPLATQAANELALMLLA